MKYTTKLCHRLTGSRQRFELIEKFFDKNGKAIGHNFCCMLDLPRSEVDGLVGSSDDEPKTLYI